MLEHCAAEVLSGDTALNPIVRAAAALSALPPHFLSTPDSLSASGHLQNKTKQNKKWQHCLFLGYVHLRVINAFKEEQLLNMAKREQIFSFHMRLWWSGSLRISSAAHLTEFRVAQLLSLLQMLTQQFLVWVNTQGDVYMIKRLFLKTINSLSI